MNRPSRFISLSTVFAAVLGFHACTKTPAADYPIRDVPFTDVRFDDAFWAPRQRTDAAVTIRHEMRQSEETGRIRNFELAAAALKGAADGKLQSRYAFDDSDVYKLIEAAAYVLVLQPDPGLEKDLDVWIDKIAAAQEPDGYLYTARTIDPRNPPSMSGPERWINLEHSHELYNVGHLYEAAAAHHQATGKRTLLDIALRSADFIARTFGPGQDQLKLPPGHEEIEIGLVKLYRTTGKRKYLDLAKFFVDQRGRGDGRKLYGTYSQDHKPLVDQEEAVGHAVRAAYFYSGAADVAALTGETGYLPALDRIWKDVVSRKLYLTGGIGAAGGIEGFGPPYELGNATGYAETCATIAFALWNHRMFRLHGEAKYMDLFERAAYNAFLSGSGMSGDLFFYPNPLASHGQHERSPWFSCACCPPNVARFIASMGGYAYGVADDRVYVNLFVQGRGRMKASGTDLELIQTTEYPWKGDVRIEVRPARPARFALMVRIPGWAANTPVPSDLYVYPEPPPASPEIRINGGTVEIEAENGYAPLAREWRSGDVVEISFPMPVRRVQAHPSIKDDLGRVAIERGPLVYAGEGVDNDGAVSHLILEDAAPLRTEWRPDLLNGVNVVVGEGRGFREKAGRIVEEARPITLIPYYAWAHRGRGEMAVWLARTKEKARVRPEPTLASKARVSASEGVKGQTGVNDQIEPEHSADHAGGYAHWWPKNGTVEWIQYEFESPAVISETSVYWFDDTGTGGCRVPVSWRALVPSGGDWVPVKAAGPFGVEKDTYNVVRFAPVRTSALRLEIRLPETFSTGIQEWRVR